MAHTEQILYKLLKQIAEEQRFVNYDMKIEPISSGGSNFTSALYNITISEGEKCLHMFAKVAASGEAMRSQVQKLHHTENLFYSKILKVYEQLQDEHEVQQEHRLVFPKFYSCNTELYEETIVLENLVKEGYQAYDRFKSIDWEYAKSAITELAKLHSLAYAYGKHHPEEYNKLINDLKRELTPEMMTGYMKSMNEKAINVTREENKENLRKFLDVLKYETILQHKRSQRQVLGHGDFKPSNLMHKIRQVS